MSSPRADAATGSTWLARPLVWLAGALGTGTILGLSAGEGAGPAAGAALLPLALAAFLFARRGRAPGWTPCVLVLAFVRACALEESPPPGAPLTVLAVREVRAGPIAGRWHGERDGRTGWVEPLSGGSTRDAGHRLLFELATAPPEDGTPVAILPGSDRAGRRAGRAERARGTSRRSRPSSPTSSCASARRRASPEPTSATGSCPSCTRSAPGSARASLRSRARPRPGSCARSRSATAKGCRASASTSSRAPARATCSRSRAGTSGSSRPWWCSRSRASRRARAARCSGSRRARCCSSCSRRWPAWRSRCCARRSRSSSCSSRCCARAARARRRDGPTGPRSWRRPSRSSACSIPPGSARSPCRSPTRPRWG